MSFRQSWLRALHSIKFPVLSAAIVPAVLMFVLLTSNFLYDQSELLFGGLEKQGKVMAAHLASSSEYGLASGNIDYLNEIAASQVRDPQVDSVIIIDRQGRELVRQQQPTNQPTPSGRLIKFEAPVYLHQAEQQVLSLMEGEGMIPSDKNALQAQRQLGRVVVVLSTHIADAEQRTVVVYGISLGLVSLLIAIIVGVRIANNFTSRVDKVTSAIRRIRRGAYDQPVERITRKNDELSILAKDVDALSAELAEAKMQLKTHMDALVEARASADELVERRTRELALARDAAVKVNHENRKLIREMNRLLEEERRYIAREIHDQLNAVIVAVRLGLQRIQRRLETLESPAGAQADVREQIGEVIDMVAKSYNVSRQIIRRLRPEIIDALGLRGALEEMVANYNRLHADCQFELSMTKDVVDLGDEANIAIYRIVQEALNNTVKHSSAAHVKVTISCHEAEGSPAIYVSVEDNGQGFDMSTAHGIGTLSMRERAVGVGGELRIQSSMHGGTRVSATIPIPKVDHRLQGEDR